MVTSEIPQFSAQLELVLGLRQVGQSDLVSAQQHISRALDIHPAIENEIGHLIPDLAMKQTWKSPVQFALASLDALPSNITRTGLFKQQVLSQVYMALAFEDYHAGRRGSAVRHIFSGLRYAPSILKNRGVLAVLARSFLNRRQNEIAPESTSQDVSERIPDSISSEIRTALGRAIDRVERVMITRRKIYLIQVGAREYALHILIGHGKESLERRLALAERIRAMGIPAPAPVVSSLSRPEANDFYWILEEKMPGSPFFPGRMSLTDQQNTVTSLGRYLRRLHSIAVAGFGPVKSGKLDAPYETFDAWMDSRQGAILEACFLGVLPETVLPALNGAYHFLRETYLQPAALCHCELTDQNILVEEGHVSGLIDWESASGGDPAYDVAVFLTTMSSHWYPKQDHTMLTTLLRAYEPDDLDYFYRRVKAHRILFIASTITWVMQQDYGDERYHRLLISIINDAKQNDWRMNSAAFSM